MGTFTYLPEYRRYIVNASTEIFAARYGPYKAHWITSPGLGGGRYPTPGNQHDPGDPNQNEESADGNICNHQSCMIF